MNSDFTPNENLQAVIDGTDTSDGGTMLTGGAIDHARVVTLISSLAFEINTGMKMTRFPLTRVAESYGIFSKSKKKCLREMLAYYKNFYGVNYLDESGRISQALGKK
jgi:hypothetical protein